MTWSGHKVRTARANIAVRLPLPCSICGRPVTASDSWDVDHRIPRWAGGPDQPWNYWPAHSRCNRSQGGKRGSHITNARKAEPKMDAAAQRGIRGI